MLRGVRHDATRRLVWAMLLWYGAGLCCYGVARRRPVLRWARLLRASATLLHPEIKYRKPGTDCTENAVSCI
eukprot:397820-Rhodomonas_salina.1